MQFETKSALRAFADVHASPSKGPWLRLLGQVMALSEEQGQLVRHSERPWASATFSGSRHSIALAFEGAEAVEAGERLIAALDEHEFDITGWLVADAAVVEARHELLPIPALAIELEVLLLEDL